MPLIVIFQPKRKFIIADTPGHEQYTRNIATGASACDLAILLIDARKGVLDQTRRHSFISTLLGIRHLVVVVNKMDLVAFDQQVFERIRQDYLRFTEQSPVDLNIIAKRLDFDYTMWSQNKISVS